MPKNTPEVLLILLNYFSNKYNFVIQYEIAHLGGGHSIYATGAVDTGVHLKKLTTVY